MPPSENDNSSAVTQATKAEILYLLNLTFLPVIAFILLLSMKSNLSSSSSALEKSHIMQTINASIWAGVLMVGVNSAILFFSGLNNVWTWVYVITYFTSIHSVLIIFGVIGISKAQGNRFYAYPFISRTCNDPDLIT